MTKLINLTPHALSFQIGDASLTIPPSGDVALVQVSSSVLTTLDVDGLHIPVRQSSYGAVNGLPDPQPGIVFLVSLLVQQALLAAGVQRGDVMGPDTGPSAIRVNGQVSAVVALQKI